MISFPKFEKAIHSDASSITSEGIKEPKLTPQVVKQAANRITFKEAVKVLRIAKKDKVKAEMELQRILQAKKEAQVNYRPKISILD